MVRLTGHSEGGWFSFHDIHRLVRPARLGLVVGVGGWVEHRDRVDLSHLSAPGACQGCGVWVFGTLLGPEGTPACRVFSGCSWPGPSNASLVCWFVLAVVGVVVVDGGLGCGCVLSVA